MGQTAQTVWSLTLLLQKVPQEGSIPNYPTELVQFFTITSHCVSSCPMSYQYRLSPLSRKMTKSPPRAVCNDFYCIYLFFDNYVWFCIYLCLSDIVSWKPEGHYCRSTMFRWEPEGRYRHRLCTAIAPFRFSMEHLWIAIMPFWLSTDDMWKQFLQATPCTTLIICLVHSCCPSPAFDLWFYCSLYICI